MTFRLNLALAGIVLAGTLGLSPNTTMPSFAAKLHKLSASTSQSGTRNRLKGKIDRDVMEGDNLTSKGKYGEAADRYRDAINRNPKNASAYAGLGMVLGKQFKLDGAEEQFDKALEIDSKNSVAHVGKALVLINRLQSSSVTIQKNKDSMLKQAENECRQALNIDPYSPEGHYYLGQALKEQGRLDEAANSYNEAIKSDAKYSDAYAGLGMTKLMQNSLAEAASNFKQAIANNSGNSTAHYGLGKTYLKQGLVDDAIKELNTALYQYPNSAPTRLALGEAYNIQGNTVAAIREFQESIRIKPENADAYLHIADIREVRGDLEHSIAELRSGLELMPNNPDLHMRIADESLRLEKLDDAIKEYSTVLDTSPQNAQAAKGLTRGYYLKSQKEAAGAYFVSNEFESAKRMMDKAIALNPNDMELRLAQAKLRALSGETVDLKSLGTPRTDGERVAYAEALLAQNRFKDSQDQINMVISSAHDAKQTFAVADLALMIKDLDSAEAAYRKAASYPGGEDRAKRGLDLTAKARETARQDLTLADDLSKKKQLASAVDKYHSSIFGNPKVPHARMGLAKTLERLSPQQSKDLREAAVQYKAYIALTPDLPPKEVDKLQKKITKLEEKAYKLDQKAKNR
jgi:tetratricopeptide (TPR) repeat protein